MTCNDCGRDIYDCDRYGCREIRGVAWAKPLLPAKLDPQECICTVAGVYDGCPVHDSSKNGCAES